LNTKRKILFKYGIPVPRGELATSPEQALEIASKFPEKLIKFPIDPLEGVRTYHATYMAKKLGYKGKQMLELTSVLSRLYKAAIECDAELMEMNPLVEILHQR